MKFRLLIAVLILAGTGAFVFSHAALAQTGTTGTATLAGTASNNGCTLVDPEAAAASQGSSSTNTTGSGSSVPVTGATATTAPAAGTTAPTATLAPTATTAATATTAPAASTPAATSTMAPTTAPSTGTGSTGSTTTTGNAVTDPHENPYCVGMFRMDIAVPMGSNANITSANLSSLNEGTSNVGNSSNFANSNNGTTSANGQGSVPVTGSTSGTGGFFQPNYGFNVYDSSALSGGQAVTINLNGANGNSMNAAHMEICAADLSGSANIYMWMSSAMWSTWYKSSTTPARWVRLPTTHTGSMACTQSWLAGTYAVH